MMISIVVTNWNGLKLLKKNFEAIVESCPEAQEVILADDASSDSSIEFAASLQTKYPQIKIIKNKINLGFGQNSNNAVRKSKGDLVVLLNNDILPRKNFLKHSLKHFSKKNVFGVGFSEIGRENWARIFWKNGYLQHEPGLDVTKTHISAWLSGGSSVVRRDLFLKLNGFDPVYSPFYSEDLDLGYRAWKSGYSLLWEPESRVEHRHEATISKFPKTLLEYVKERNRLLTVWRNISDPQMLRQNKLAIIGRLVLGPNYIKIIRAANKQIKSNPPPTVFPSLTDKEIFSLFS
ncbi:MAG: glycosyltransferase family 2 protein [Patescibacteria group bacterium]|jgi:GT2 family glycosyltransferase